MDLPKILASIKKLEELKELLERGIRTLDRHTEAMLVLAAALKALMDAMRGAAATTPPGESEG